MKPIAIVHGVLWSVIRRAYEFRCLLCHECVEFVLFHNLGGREWAILRWSELFAEEICKAMFQVSKSLCFFNIDSKPVPFSDRISIARPGPRQSRFRVHQRGRGPGNLNSKPSRSVLVPHYTKQELQRR